MRTEKDYRAIEKILQGLEQSLAEAHGQCSLYLSDESIDRENVVEPETSPLFWDAMCQQAENAAGVRAEDYGIAIQDYGINY